MAYSSVVTSVFFDKMAAFLTRLEQDNGPIAMALMTPWSLGRNETWNLLIAAEWLDRELLVEGTVRITKEARQFLGPLAKKYEGTSIRRTNQTIVESVTSSFDIPHPGTAYRVHSSDLTSLDIEEAILFISNPAAIADRQPESVHA